ncbi:MAG: hypothetical protein PHE67_06720 [Campylobacterales bacterium]|nr:hypothetical protein [Campylobacterales bacterium]
MSIEWVSNEEAGTFNKEFFSSIEEQKAFFRALIIDLMHPVGHPAAKEALRDYIQVQNNPNYQK